MKKTAHEREPKTAPRGKAERIVKFGPKVSPIRARIIRVVE